MVTRQLSESTKAFLDGICFASNFFWTEGGMSYAELNPALELGDSNPLDCEQMPSHLPSGYDQNVYSKLHDQLAKLSLFLHRALGHNTDIRPVHLPLDNVRTGFLGRLNEDVHAQFFEAKLEECEFGMDIRINFADKSNQTLCMLKTVWRID